MTSLLWNNIISRPLWFSLLLPPLLLLCQSPTVAAERRTFVWFSDLHLDPYYGTDQAVNHNKLDPSADCGPPKATTHPYGDVGCDSPPALVHSLLQQASSHYPNTDFVVITGDFVRHSNDELLPSPMNATEAILTNVSKIIRHYYPDSNDIPVVSALGNNDVTPDYYLDIDNPQEMLGMVSRGLAPLLGDQQSSTFQQGGYYAMNVTERITIISLNTILYSTNHQPPKPNLYDDDDDPLGQFAWLQEQLEVAAHAHRKVFLVGHIPPTIGSYRHTQLWQEQYLERYYSIVGGGNSETIRDSVVKAQLFGHIHTDEFRVHRGMFPIFLTSSFTPIYGSNPSFRVVTYDSDTSDLLDYNVEYLDLAAASASAALRNNTDAKNVHWKQGESFTEAFQVPDMGLASLKTIVGDLQNSTDTSVYWEALLTRLHVYTHGSEVCGAACRRAWACTFSSMTTIQYDTCVLESWVKSDPLLTIGVLVAISLVLLVGLLVCLRSVQRCRQRRHYEVPNLEELHMKHMDEVGESDKDEVGASGDQQLPEVS